MSEPFATPPRLPTSQSIGELGDFDGFAALVLMPYEHSGSVPGAAAV